MLRLSRSYTQKRLAKLLEVDESLISQYETCSTTPSIEIIIKLSSIFSVSTDTLLGIEDMKKDYIDYDYIYKNFVGICDLSPFEIKTVKYIVKSFNKSND